MDDDDEEEEEEEESDGEGWDSDEAGTDISHEEEQDPASVPNPEPSKVAGKSTKVDTSKKAEAGSKQGQ